jgi:uncharacterized protein
MTTYRIGIISDTHYPERVPYLPYEAIEKAFRGCDLIIHAGDLESMDVITQLETIAPVYAVRSDDGVDTFSLPEKRIIEIGGLRIGLHHGHRPYIIELPGRFKSGFSLHRGINWAGIHDWLLEKFQHDNVQAIVFGHFHITYSGYHDGILLFNPGSIYKLSRAALYWRSKHARSAFRRFTASIEYRLKIKGQQTPQPTIGLITIENGKLSTEHIELPHINYDESSSN